MGSTSVQLRLRDGIVINRKAVYRVLNQKGWFVHQRVCTPRPRVQGWTSRVDRSNKRWAIDVTHILCDQDGWAHLAAVIDCHDREVIGYEFALRSRAKEAERAVEATVLRSDNGLIFQSRRFRQACRDYRIQQEFITRYTPEQNGIIERFFRSLKEECIWQQTFQRFEEACRIRRWGIEARSYTGLNNQPRWLDFRGALHGLQRAVIQCPSVSRYSGTKYVVV